MACGGRADAGAMWRSNYDMPPDQFAKEEDRLWEQLRPLYESLHAYVRGQLRKKYGSEIVPARGPIPAHLLGNIWSQEWNNVYSLMESPKPTQSYDLTKILAIPSMSKRCSIPGSRCSLAGEQES